MGLFLRAGSMRWCDITVRAYTLPQVPNNNACYTTRLARPLSTGRQGNQAFDSPCTAGRNKQPRRISSRPVSTSADANEHTAVPVQPLLSLSLSLSLLSNPYHFPFSLFFVSLTAGSLAN
eukprot:123609-Chlamydomonas_euryale.AAC.3